MTRRDKKGKGICLSEQVRDSVETYFDKLNGHQPAALYDLVLAEMEKPLLEVVLDRVDGNLTRAAAYLGMNRATLRKKLAKHNISI